MKCTVCNGKGSFEDAGKFFNCFICGGSGNQSMYFWGETDERIVEGEEHRVCTGKTNDRSKKQRKPRKSHAVN